MHKGYLRTAFIIAGLSVIFGAFGAHGLREQNVSQRAVEIFETAVRYQFFHAIALALSGILYKEFPNKWIKTSGIFFLLGILLFSGSLYILTYATASVSPNFKWVGPITPVGGIMFIVGWVYLAIGIRNKKDDSQTL
jgi:uncharacterized membrane protein YgdD (TMEM256/DUF423 family)